MPRTCLACRHPDRKTIDEEILAGTPNRRIASRVGTSEAAIRRHAAHVSETVALAVKAGEQTRADDLLGILHEGVKDARRIRDRAEKEGDLRCAVMSVKTLADLVESLVKVAERLARAKAEREERIFDSPDWIEVREVLVSALMPYPEAMEAVGRAMEAVAERQEGDGRRD